jgi:hypothetical protein
MTKQLASLAWKEWHEARTYLWIGLGVFLGLPIVAGIEAMWQYSRRFEVASTPWVLMFGGILVVFVAVGTTCRDLNGRVEEFWRSRPVGIVRWLLVKYAVGLTIAVLACAIPMIAEFLVDRINGVVRQDLSLRAYIEMFLEIAALFLLMVPPLFSLAFLAGCVVRRAAHAAMLAFAAALLLFLLPILLPPLKWFNWEDVEWGENAAPYAAALVAISVITLVIAMIAVRRGWRVQSGRKLMYAAVAVVILILLGSAAYQLGTDMPILQEISLRPAEQVIGLQSQNYKGFVMTQQYDDAAAVKLGFRYESEQQYRPFKVTASAIVLGEPDRRPTRGSEFYSGWYGWPGWYAQLSPEGHPEISYGVESTVDDTTGEQQCNLQIYRHGTGGGSTMRLWSLPSNGSTWVDGKQLWYSDWSVGYVWKDRLYVIGRQLVILDIADPLRPKILSNTPFSSAFFEQEAKDRAGGYWSYAQSTNRQPDKLVWDLPPIPDLPAQQRLEARLKMGGLGRSIASDGKILCELDGDGLTAWRLKELTDKKAVFEPIGQYKPTILEAAFGNFNYGELYMANGLLYLSSGGRWGWGGYGIGRQIFNPHVSVFDVRGPGRIRLVGHFASPGLQTMSVLPDGRVIAGGDKIWLIGPPPGYAGK